ncbi:MAG: uridine kinase [Gemmatimonadetes bacterium]|nr:uridine kinase [Gemmatimonadota bacterium]
MDVDAVVQVIERTDSRGRTRLVAIDGCGGAGKSSLAEAIAERIDDAAIVHVDDFWHARERRPDRATVVGEPGSDYDWERLRDQVVVPLVEGLDARYQRYDWETDSLAEWHDVTGGGTVVVEGVFSTRVELIDYYDVRVWVDTPADVCLARGIERDGEQHRHLWENEWMKAYERYVEASDPVERADVVVRGL